MVVRNSSFGRSRSAVTRVTGEREHWTQPLGPSYRRTRALDSPPRAELPANESTGPYRRTRALDPHTRSSVSRVLALSFGGNSELPANERSRPPPLGRVTGEREH